MGAAEPTGVDGVDGVDAVDGVDGSGDEDGVAVTTVHTGRGTFEGGIITRVTNLSPQRSVQVSGVRVCVCLCVPMSACVRGR